MTLAFGASGATCRKEKEDYMVPSVVRSSWKGPERDEPSRLLSWGF